MDYGQIILLPNHLLQKGKTKGFFLEKMHVYSLSYACLRLKNTCNIGLDQFFFSLKKKYNCTVPFSYITQKLHLIFDAQDIYICVSLQKTGYLFSNGQV